MWRNISTCIIIVIIILFIMAGLSSIYVNVTIQSGEVQIIDLHEILFQNYMRNFSKNYGNDEYKLRLHNFKESLKEIAHLNQNAGAAIYGPTKYSDMTEEEFRNTMLMKKGIYESCEPYHSSCTHMEYKDNVTKWNGFPQKLDWRDRPGAVGPVLDQGTCCSCWAISVVEVMESKMIIEMLEDGYRPLSIQELIDCSTLTNGCEGGNVAFAMKYLCKHMWPITWADEYPLKFVDEQCLFRPVTGVLLESFTVRCDVSPMDIVAILNTKGPVTAAVNSYNWMHYLGGIIQYHCSGNDELRHVVQIVGYDLTTDPPHFIIKNSWGKDFGIKGYMKIAMGDFTCGIGKQIGYLKVYTTD